MLFNSLEFLFFGILFYLIWLVFKHKARASLMVLVVFSAFFYGWWDWRFLGLLAANGFAVFFLALGIEKWPQQKKLFLSLSILINLGCLFLFKYLGFFTSSVNSFFGLFNVQTGIPVITLGLPLGISFFTFECLSYVIDVYKGILQPTRSLLKFFAFLSLFPHLIAGPIVRPYDLFPQLDKPAKLDEPRVWEGIRLVTQGFFKKVVVADNLAPIVNQAFASPDVYASMPYWWLIVTLFAIQIYCDFSGYSDIACGLAKWMGFDFNPNFNHPYIARSLREFWTRWHISLSTWFRDYVYIPMGGAKKGVLAGMAFMWVTMLVSGFWHGAAWKFLIWGGLHAFYLSFERWTKWPELLSRHALLKPIAVVFVLIQVWVAWVFFRANSTSQAFAIVKTMFDPKQLSMAFPLQLDQLILPIVFFVLLWEIYYYLKDNEHRLLLPARLATVFEVPFLAIMATAAIYFRGPGGAFIYFQF